MHDRRKHLPAEAAAATIPKLEKKKASHWPKVSAYIAICMKRRTSDGKENPEWEEIAAVAAATQVR